MAEYIERGAYIKMVEDIPMWGSVAARMANNIPAADVVPVVRCKECKHMDEWEEGLCMCNHGRTVRVKPDHFCSYGELK